MELENREKDLADTLQALGNRIASQDIQESSGENPASVPSVPAEKKSGLSPEQQKAWLERIRDGQNLKQDLAERIASGAALQQNLSEKIEEEKKAVECLGERIRSLSESLSAVQEPDCEELIPTHISDYVREIERLRLEWMRIHALLEAGTSRTSETASQRPEKTVSAPAESGWRFFLPLILVLVFCTLFLSAALFIAWKVPL